ncbi:hypothetical protein SYNPS1DRAFT_24171 [Syncephalis pseudoplumigaleata]|uniref:G-protein coupled receptors family 1 profile domain-containing protein n=1 Tax=Syncephalis pseudoplumigaleata TaxID=1712513 RepID=A0A4P9YUU6_9FUNG|nr:hypothetical protein SYNPS1DRAFT_24171 [Syncephalis pseudoplumigaleata]|eukprot:RKP23757.1 hypothetical protein SYNPS1DRAFT_24171 [Syncephalis pseudoplumigaleata]
MQSSSASGTLNGYQFITEAHDNEAAFRRRFVAVYFELFAIALVFLCFVRNFYRAARLLHMCPRKIASWCCATMTAAGVLAFPCGLFTASPFGPSCNLVIWEVLLGMVVFTMATNIAMLERAYLAHGRRRWLLAVGALSIVGPGPLYVSLAWYTSTAAFSDMFGCNMRYRSFLPYIRLLLDLPANVVFSAIFLRVVYRAYRRHHDQCWRELGRDGIITMLQIILSNLVCFTLNVSQALKEFSDVFYILDW